MGFVTNKSIEEKSLHEEGKVEGGERGDEGCTERKRSDKGERERERDQGKKNKSGTIILSFPAGSKIKNSSLPTCHITTDFAQRKFVVYFFVCVIVNSMPFVEIILNFSHSGLAASLLFQNSREDKNNGIKFTANTTWHEKKAIRGKNVARKMCVYWMSLDLWTLFFIPYCHAYNNWCISPFLGKYFF